MLQIRIAAECMLAAPEKVAEDGVGTSLNRRSAQEVMAMPMRPYWNIALQHIAAQKIDFCARGRFTL